MKRSIKYRMATGKIHRQRILDFKQFCLCGLLRYPYFGPLVLVKTGLIRGRSGFYNGTSPPLVVGLRAI